MDSLKFLNGNKLVDTANLLKTRKWKYGESLFTSFRVNKNYVLLFEKHIERIEKSVQSYFKKDISAWNLSSKLTALLNEHCQSDKNYYGRIEVFANETNSFILKESEIELNFYLEIKEIPKLERKNITAYSLSEKYIVKTQTNISSMKIPSYMNEIEMLSSLKDVNEDVLVLFDNQIVEASTSAFYLVKDEAVYLPKVTGFLQSISQLFVKICLDELGIKYFSREIKIKDLVDGDEVFLSNSIKGITPIEKFGKIEFMNWKNEASVTMRLISHYYSREIE
ncbi:MAG: branched-subunit amino acid aminotransferase/4-amino-4-deoxychorismate lyase [Thermoproteota archaeon]|jgi:branched-subunit amino acid aminotransferase/4-amino-4-deoxychorismate lyase